MYGVVFFMFFKPNARKQAQDVFSVISRFVTSIKHDPDIFEDSAPSGYGATVLGCCMFVMTGFLNDKKVVFHLAEIYRETLQEDHCLSTAEIQMILNRVNASYQDMREFMIERQAAVGNNIEQLWYDMADKMGEMLGVPNSLYANRPLQDYLATFYSKAKEILK